MSALTQGEVIGLLRQQVQAGCTDVLAEAPVNQYASQNNAVAFQAPPQEPITPTPSAEQMPDAIKAAPQAVKPPAITKPIAQMAAPEAPEHAIEQAIAVSAAADTLDALKQAMQDFDGCALKTTAKNLVFSDGVPDAKIMLIGEAPGQDEDRLGKPFVGRSGQLLDTMLAAIGLSRDENIYIANIVPWRPPGNRTPTLEEIAICKPFIARHIELIQPEYLLLVGNISTKTILETATGITKLRGQWQNYEPEGRNIKSLPLLHPAYVLRRPETKIEVWSDLCRFKQALINA